MPWGRLYNVNFWKEQKLRNHRRVHLEMPRAPVVDPWLWKTWVERVGDAPTAHPSPRETGWKTNVSGPHMLPRQRGVEKGFAHAQNDWKCWLARNGDAGLNGMRVGRGCERGGTLMA